MSNRNTKVYDDLLVNASTTNEEICKDLNLPHNGNNQCVDDTKYYVNNSDSVKNNSSNLDCSINSSNEKKIVTVKTRFTRPWSRFNTTCVYNNGNNTFATVSNNIKKTNVRRKAEILKYSAGNRLTKAEKYANFSRGINRYRKKQYAYQTMNRVPGNTLTTDPNAYGYNASGQDGGLNDISDWLSDNTLSRLEGEQENPTGITLLKCPNKQPFNPIPLSSSDVPRVSKNKLDNPETNPFPVLGDVNNPDTRNNLLDSSENPINNHLYLNENDNLINYTPVKRTYKGGSEKWPQSTWEEGDKGYPVFKSGSSGDIHYEGYYDSDGNYRYTDTSISGYYDTSGKWVTYSSTESNPIISGTINTNNISVINNGPKPFQDTISYPFSSSSETNEGVQFQFVFKKYNTKLHDF